MLQKWINDNGWFLDKFALEIGITRQSLWDILLKKSPRIKVQTALRIKALTGLEPWDYLDGLEEVKKIIQKQNGTTNKNLKRTS